MRALGLDIGGANLKAFHQDGQALAAPFALWRQPAALADRLHALAANLPPFNTLAVTTTAELCDCFADKREGVAHVLAAAADLAGPRPVRVWLTERRFADLEEARQKPLAVAAANWHALATFLAHAEPEPATLLIDTGSTTTDLCWLQAGRLEERGLTDFDRLRQGSLLYLGAGRTSLMALGPRVIFRGQAVAVMAEHFATTADLLVLTGAAAEAPDCHDTADGQPLTVLAAARRVLRMIGGDLEMFSPADAQELARAFLGEARRRLMQAMAQIAAGRVPDRVVFAGSGSRLARVAATEAFPAVPQADLADRLGPAASTAACALALVRLLQG